MTEQNSLAAEQNQDNLANLERDHAELEDRFSRLIALLEQQGVEFTDEMRDVIEGELEDNEYFPDEITESIFEEIQLELSLSQRFSLAQRIIAETSAHFLECLPTEGQETYDSSYVDVVITVGANLARLDSAAQALADVQLIEIIDGDSEEDDEKSEDAA